MSKKHLFIIFIVALISNNLFGQTVKLQWDSGQEVKTIERSETLIIGQLLEQQKETLKLLECFKTIDTKMMQKIEPRSSSCRSTFYEYRFNVKHRDSQWHPIAITLERVQYDTEGHHDVNLKIEHGDNIRFKDDDGKVTKVKSNEALLVVDTIIKNAQAVNDFLDSKTEPRLEKITKFIGNRWINDKNHVYVAYRLYFSELEGDIVSDEMVVIEITKSLTQKKEK